MHRVSVERHSRTAIVQATGELDAFAAPDLSCAFEQLIGETRILADLDRVSFLDSTVLGLIVRLTRELGARKAELRVVLPQGPARRIFEITGLDRALPVVRSRSAGLDELAAD